MYIDHISLMNYRTYSLLNLPLSTGVTVFLGANGVGKTNIVEAINYTAELSSHRVSHDGPLVQVGAQRAYIRTRVVRGKWQTITEFEIAPGHSNRVRINRAAPVRAREALGITTTVFFSPEDLQLVKGEPQCRRRFVDDMAVSLRPVVASYRSDYERILRQRNSLLKTMRGGRITEEHRHTLTIWNEQIAQAGALLVHSRWNVLARLMPEIQYAYQRLTDGSKAIGVTYESTIFPDITDATLPHAAQLSVADIAQEWMRAIEDKQQEEIERGVSLVGAHRDEMIWKIGDIPAKGFASHGESWSLALALKLGSWYVHRKEHQGVGSCPILILDDVFAELDTARRKRLGSIVSDAEQVLVTCAIEEDIPQELGDDITMVRVSPGQVAFGAES
ncbi:DNA replication/repair protein RecF [Rothia sp. CCM 9418]|uniref:DNA replication/repair protein RecF n=1 Tax=Rothia sp. CCM 9418 TaxID=3402661 RepID=UPI003AEE5C67